MSAPFGLEPFLHNPHLQAKTRPISTRRWRQRRPAVSSDGFAQKNQTHATGSSDAHAAMTIHGITVRGSTVNGSDQHARYRYGYYTYYYVYTTTLTHVVGQYETVDWSSGPRVIVTLCPTLAALPRSLHHTHPNQVNTSCNRVDGVEGGMKRRRRSAVATARTMCMTYGDYVRVVHPSSSIIDFFQLTLFLYDARVKIDLAATNRHYHVYNPRPARDKWWRSSIPHIPIYA